MTDIEIAKQVNLENILDIAKKTNIDENEEDTKIFVHVTGAVKSEGIVKIKEEGRIADAVEAANGFTEDADISQINLAYKLEDGQKIYIPSINDEKVKENVRLYNQASPLLCGNITSYDKITDRKVKSLKDAQLSFFE